MTFQLKKLGTITAVSLLTICSCFNAYAAPGTLETTPLFVSTAVEPNVFFTLDDSGSMDWEAMIPDTGDFSYNNGVTQYNGYWQAYLHPGWSSYQYSPYSDYDKYDRNIIPPAAYSNSSSSTLIKSFWVMQNHNYNTTYYNPSTTYTPWAGIDSDTGQPYQDAIPTAVLRDPTRKTYDKTDLTANFDFYDNIVTKSKHSNIAYLPSYYTWTDDNNNGELEVSETHSLIEIREGNTFPSGRTYEKELQNFANWFQYYRKREFSTKASVGRAINKSDTTRMGLRLINGGHKKDLKTMTSSTNKQELLNTFYEINSNSGTPLRRALENTGKMYLDPNSNAILPESGGGACQQNFTLLMTDGFWNGNDPDVGHADRSTDNVGFDGDETESNDGGNYEDDNSNTLADVAMYYYENDLSNLENKVPTTPGTDLADHQHMVTYTVSFGVTGTIDPDNFDPLATEFSWPPPNNDPRKVDDLLHAAYNGRGLYLSAQDPVQLEKALTEAIANIAERTATAAAASVTSAKLTTDTIVYLAEFNTNRWQGTIYAYKIANFNTGELEATPTWSAAQVLNARDITADPRTILSYGNDGIAFQWANLTSDMKADLQTNEAGEVDSPAIAEARLNYIRGDRSDEGQGNFFRERASLLGDIVNSGPVYVGKPDLRWPETFPVNNPSTPYSSFKTDKENRSGVIYVGANDGMLHGFDESTGKELIAYIPSNLFSTESDKGLHYLTEQNYKHQFYNDLTPSISDIHINSNWHTVLISGQRSGGRGYYALDITDPSNFSESNAASIAMWEFTSDDDANLGYTYSKPQIAMTNDGKWVAIFGNGYNSTGDNEAKLFIVDIAAGADGSWDAGDYKVISTGTIHNGGANGLATPALADLDNNGTIDRVYAGDLNGDMWAFDLSGSTKDSWVTAYGEKNPLFTTEGNRPITSKPILSFHPSEPSDDSNAPNIMVFFGSGQYLVESDKDLTKDISTGHYFYGVWDKGTSGLKRSNLVEQTFRDGFSSYRVLTRNNVDYSGGDYGWNISLDVEGERSVTNPAVRGDVVFFNTSVPTSDPCSTGGYGYRFAVDLETGGSPNEPVLVDLDNDGIVDSEDTLDKDNNIPVAEKLEGGSPPKSAFTDKNQYIGKDPFSIGALDEPNFGRFSWQELLK